MLVPIPQHALALASERRRDHRRRPTVEDQLPGDEVDRRSDRYNHHATARPAPSWLSVPNGDRDRSSGKASDRATALLANRRAIGRIDGPNDRPSSRRMMTKYVEFVRNKKNVIHKIKNEGGKRSQMPSTRTRNTFDVMGYRQ